MSKMLKSTGAMGAATLTSRILGMVREMSYTHFMGAGMESSAFRLAFMIPNLFRRLLGEGALTASFIPIFKNKEANEGEKSMWQAANAVVSGLLVAAAALIILATLFFTVVIWWGGSGLVPLMKNDTTFMFRLARIMFPYLLFVCLAAIYMAILNARGSFFVPAMGAVVLNLVLIATVWLVAPQWAGSLENQVIVLSVGVLVAGIAQAAYQLPALRRQGYRFEWISPWKDPTVRQVVRKMIPGTMGVAAFQLNVVITQSLAWDSNRSSVAAFDAAVRLMEFPQGIFGISLATYLLPTLAGIAAEKKYPDFCKTYLQGVGYLMFANLLAAALLAALATPMIRLLFEHGKFTAYDTHRSALALAWLAPGLIAFSFNNVTARAFYALGDTKTPMQIATVCLILNVIFGFMLIPTYDQTGMAIANSLSGMFNLYFLQHALKRKLKSLSFTPLIAPIGHMLAGALAAGMAAWGCRMLWQSQLGHSTIPLRLGEVMMPVAAGTLIYFGLLHWFRISQATEMVHMVTKRFRKR